MQFTGNNKYNISKNGGIVLLSAIFLLCVFIRVYRLNDKPMHVDEAVHAIKFGYLLENNYYQYNPVEYHGPTLNYFSLIPAWILGEGNITEVTETTLRLVPVFSGLILILMLLLLKDIGKELIVAAVIITGFSSLNIFYNRYYIQESLLVSFSYSALILLYRYHTKKNLMCIIFSAFFFALAFASKETFIITVFSTAVSYFILRFIKRKKLPKFSISWKPLLIFFSTFIIISILFFTSFFSNLRGGLDSILTFANYFGKAGSNTEHIQPFYYYFSLVSFRIVDDVFFSELLIIIFFIFGLARAFSKTNKNSSGIGFVRFISILTVIMTFIYSVIPYKTPWTMMSFWQGMILIAAFGFAELVKFIPKANWYLLLSLIGIFMFVQSYYNSIVYSFNPQNPFVYSHAGNDVKTIEPFLTKVTAVQSEYLNMPIYVAAVKSDYWPLPWYLRKFKNTSWNDRIADNVYKFPIVIASPELESELIEKIYTKAPAGNVNLYVPLFDKYMEIRPGKEMRGYIRKDYFDNYLNALSK
ncbi:MAG: TIGR03663 family protein [Ignavibacteriales bacterium]|nr:TIGR03663 family protein [Ignavibacteriales bacterium]